MANLPTRIPVPVAVPACTDPNSTRRALLEMGLYLESALMQPGDVVLFPQGTLPLFFNAQAILAHMTTVGAPLAGGGAGTISPGQAVCTDAARIARAAMMIRDQVPDRPIGDMPMIFRQLNPATVPRSLAEAWLMLVNDALNGVGSVTEAPAGPGLGSLGAPAQMVLAQMAMAQMMLLRMGLIGPGLGL